MALQKAATLTPVAIPVIEIILRDAANGADDTGQSAKFDLVVAFSNGERKRIGGNLVPHLTAQQITTIQAFLTTMRQKALAEVLP